MMIRRSLNTFMNAFTSSDWTAYPFASQNKKDFNNLLEVYLDAVFFARLDPLDFAQEGHRLEFAKAEDSTTELTYKGVVFNEMKGAMSSINSTLWQTMSKNLYPTSTYHYNSGGEPADIPNLTFDQFKEFYKTHYHPSNAIFITFGDMPAAEQQQKFQDHALHRFEMLNKQIAVTEEKRYSQPQYFEEYYAFEDDQENSNLEDKTHIVIAWLLGNSTSLEDTMRARLLSSVLLDNSGSPLQKALETTGLGTAPSPMCGLEDSQLELCFACGIEGSNPEQADAVETMILKVIEDVAQQGLPFEQVEASLHQLELSQREITGGSYPYGLSLILTSLTSATHRGDPVSLLDLDPVLDNLKQQIRDPEYIKSLARELLLNNKHRIRLVLKPDTQLANVKDTAEKDRLASIKAQLSEEQKKEIVDSAYTLKQRQEMEEDLDILPKVDLSDIPEDISFSQPDQQHTSPIPLTSYGTGTNGIVYQQMIMPLPTLTAEQMDLLPLYSACVTEMGVGSRDYQQTQLWHSSLVGSYSAAASVRTHRNDLTKLHGNLTVACKGLACNQQQMSELMQESFSLARFDELDRLKELIAQILTHKESSVVSNGHVLAMMAASSGLSSHGHLKERWGGITSLGLLKKLNQAITSKTGLESLANQLKIIHQLMLQQSRQYLLVSEKQRLNEFAEIMASAFAGGKTTPSAGNMIEYHPHLNHVNHCWTAATQVSFCAKAYPTVAGSHPDAPALTLLGGILRNGYLHRAIREQGGAYGAGASQDSQSGAFRFFSYRDPRIDGTLNDFDQSIQWILNNSIKDEKIEEAILGVIGSMDKPSSPAGEAIQAFYSELNGRNKQTQTEFRQRILKINESDIKRVAEEYLHPSKAQTAVITNADLAAKTSLPIIS